MDLTKVSPLPWSEKKPERSADDGIFGTDGARVSGGCDREDGECSLSEEDRAYIVHACNNYPALVAAFKNCRLEMLGERQDASWGTTVEDTEKALKAAGELYCDNCKPRPNGVIETDDMKHCAACGRKLT